LHEIECLHTLGTLESERLKVTALNLWEASRLSFDRPLPGKPPTRPPLPSLIMSAFYIVTQSPEGEGKGEGVFI